MVRLELTEIKIAVREESSTNWSDLFSMGPQRNFHRVMLGYINQVFQQISGINLITYYAGVIFQQYIGLDGTTSRLLAAANGTEYFIASFIPVWFIERVGRRTLMFIGSAGMITCMAMLAGMNYMSSVGKGGKAPGIVSVVMLFGFNTFFAIGWLGIPWLYPAEIVPLNVRARANGFSTSANWIFNFMVVMITPVAFSSIGYKTYIVFAVINFAMVPCVWLFYPETAYRSLEEIDKIFQKSESMYAHPYYIHIHSAPY
jgi:hypothetical protein